MLSKIPLELLHLKAIDCCPPPDRTLLLFDLLMVARSQADQSNERSRSAQNGSRKLVDTDNTKINTVLFISTRIKQSTKLDMLDTFDYGIALQDEFGVLDQDLGFESLVLSPTSVLQMLSSLLSCHDHLQGH